MIKLFHSNSYIFPQTIRLPRETTMFNLDKLQICCKDALCIDLINYAEEIRITFLHVKN